MADIVLKFILYYILSKITANWAIPSAFGMCFMPTLAMVVPHKLGQKLRP
jgi:hypothetical protein